MISVCVCGVQQEDLLCVCQYLLHEFIILCTREKDIVAQFSARLNRWDSLVSELLLFQSFYLAYFY